MNKVTLEISRDPNHISGYSKFTYLNENSDEILNKLIEWSNKPFKKHLKVKPIKITIYKINYLLNVLIGTPRVYPCPS